MPTLALYNATSRSATSIIPLALAAGWHVRAVVRGGAAARFSAKVAPHPNLSVHELASTDDVAALARILSTDTTAVYVAASPPNSAQPTTLVADIVQTVCAALRLSTSSSSSSTSSTPSPGRCPTHLVLLASISTSPHISYPGSSYPGLAPALPDATPAPFVVRFLRLHLIRHEYDDLARAQLYLEKQRDWLDWTALTPGGIVDAPGETEAQLREWRLSTTGEGATMGFISYARLAAAIMGVLLGEEGSGSGEAGAKGEAEDGRKNRWIGEYVTPSPTSAISLKWEHTATLRAVWWDWLRHDILVPGAKMFGLMSLAALVGVQAGRMEALGRLPWLSNLLQNARLT